MLSVLISVPPSPAVPDYEMTATEIKSLRPIVNSVLVKEGEQGDGCVLVPFPSNSALQGSFLLLAPCLLTSVIPGSVLALLDAVSSPVPIYVTGARLDYGHPTQV